MKKNKEETPLRGEEKMKQSSKSKKSRVKKFKGRVQGNTVYSVGFQSEHSEHSEKTEDEEELDGMARPPPTIAKL